MSRLVQRVRKLVALSGSSNEHEGRSAAFHACRLIREHGLDITEPAGTARRAEHPPAPPRGRSTRGPYARARGLRGEARCSECAEPITPDDACFDADGLHVHGDCIPRGERP